MKENISMAVSTERDQLAEDILYLEYLLDVEKNDIKQKMRQRLAQADSETERIEAICDEISASLAQMSARVAVLEKVMVSQVEKVNPEIIEGAKTLPAQDSAKAEVNISVEEIRQRNPLNPVKYTDSGQPFIQVMPDSRIKVDLAVDRSKKKTLAFNICEEIDSAFLDKVLIVIDGDQVKHKIACVNDHDRLICHLPVKAGRIKTGVEIITPAVFSGRLCLLDIHCVSRQTLWGYFKRLSS